MTYEVCCLTYEVIHFWFFSGLSFGIMGKSEDVLFDHLGSVPGFTVTVCH